MLQNVPTRFRVYAYATWSTLNKPGSEEGHTAFLASNFSCADSLKSALFASDPSPELVIALVGFHLLQDAVQVVGLRRLQRRELLERIEFLHPQQLADGQHVPVVQIGGNGEASAPPKAMADFESEKLTVCSNGSRLMLPTSVQ